MLRFQKVKFKPTVFKKISTHAVSRHVLYGHEAYVFQGVKGLYFFKKTGQILNPSLLRGLSFFLFSFQIIFASGFCVSFLNYFFSIQRLVFFFLHFVLCVERECFYCHIFLDSSLLYTFLENL